MIKQILGFISKNIDLEILKKFSGQNHIIPLYHTVSDSSLAHIRNLYKVKTVEEFKKDLDFFLKHYKSVTLNDLINHLRNDKNKDSVFHLTFDDGLKEIVTTIAPILLEKGVHATFFVNSDFVNNKSLFYRFKTSLLINQLGIIDKESILEVLREKLSRFTGGSLKEKLLNVSYLNKEVLDEIAELLNVDFDEYLKTEPFVNDQDIEWLLSKGFTIGAHSVDHPLYSQISLEEQILQTEESLSFLKEKYNLEDRLFAFPFSDKGVTVDFFKALKEKKSTFSFGTSGLKYDLVNLNFQRLPMENNLLTTYEFVKYQYIKGALRLGND